MKKKEEKVRKDWKEYKKGEEKKDYYRESGKEGRRKEEIKERGRKKDWNVEEEERWRLKVVGGEYTIVDWEEGLELRIGFREGKKVKVPSYIKKEKKSETEWELRSERKKIRQWIGKVEGIKASRKDKYKGKGLKKEKVEKW